MIRSFVVGLIVTASATGATATAGPQTSSRTQAKPLVSRYVFHPYATYFSAATRQPKLVDPTMFVKSDGAPATVGLQRVERTAGFENISAAVSPSVPAYSADDRQMSFTVQRWLSASGMVIVRRVAGAKPTVTARFSNLVRLATYSLFVTHSPSEPATYQPLDSKGGDGFYTDGLGNGNVSVKSTEPLNRGDAIVLVYHSDGFVHGKDRGDIGVVAANQLIARL